MRTLRRHCKRIYAIACAGDETATADLRAYAKSRQKNKARIRFKSKFMKKLIAPVVAIALALISIGCKTTSPAVYSVLTATAVSYGLRNSPDTANDLRAVQPVACALATGTNLTPAEIVAAINASGIVDNSPEARLIVNSVVLIYISAFDAQGIATNASQVRPYAQAVFCEGFKLGLDGAASERSRNAPPSRTWWPLLRK